MPLPPGTATLTGWQSKIDSPHRTFRSLARREVVMNQPSPRVLRHVVLLAFKETATRTRLQAIEQAFAGLPPRPPRSRALSGAPM